MAIITSTNLKTHLGITTTTHDTVAGYAVNATNQAVVQYCGRSFDDAGSASARVFYPRSSCLAVVDDFHTTTGLIVKTDEGDDGTYETTWSSSDYQLEPLNQLVDGITFPYYRVRAVETRYFPTSNHRAGVQITARWGWAAVPDAVFEAALIKAARVFHRKDSPQGVAGFGEFGPIRITRAQDPDVADLLENFRRTEKVFLVA